MPELPEVETSRRGIEPYVIGHKIQTVIVRQHQLRWKIDRQLPQILSGQTFHTVARRGKYLLLHTSSGTLIIHLGMSGSLRILAKDHVAQKHDHVDIIFANDKCLRFTDPRRFGAVLWTEHDPITHPLLKKLGIEPLEQEFSGDYLYRLARNRNIAVKLFIMNHQIVVGVGNIYANEALFDAKISPKLSAKKITLAQYQQLAKSIKKILQAAIRQGGTTLRNFLSGEGKPGYFIQHLKVYGRGGLACTKCKTKLKEIRLGQRSTVYCIQCQSQSRAD